MSTQHAMMWVYEVDRAGGCLMHWAIELDEKRVSVNTSVSLMPPGFFDAQKSMHEKMGHAFTLEAVYDGWKVWTVRVGEGNFEGMNICVLEMCEQNQQILKGYIDGNQTNFTSPFTNN